MLMLFYGKNFWSPIKNGPQFGSFRGKGSKVYILILRLGSPLGFSFSWVTGDDRKRSDHGSRLLWSHVSPYCCNSRSTNLSRTSPSRLLPSHATSVFCPLWGSWWWIQLFSWFISGWASVDCTQVALPPRLPCAPTVWEGAPVAMPPMLPGGLTSAGRGTGDYQAFLCQYWGWSFLSVIMF